MKRINGFPEGTFVYIEEDSDLLQIERLKVGDKVLSQCEKTGKRAYKRVTRVFEHGYDYDADDGSYETIDIDFMVPPEFTNWPLAKIQKIEGPIRGIDEYSGQPYDYSTEILKDHGIRGIEVTPEHLIWVHGRGWTAARDIQPGDQLQIIDPFSGALDSSKRLEQYSTHAFSFAPERILVTVTEVESNFACDVYNIEVEDFHTYFAGFTGVRVRDGSCI